MKAQNLRQQLMYYTVANLPSEIHRNNLKILNRVMRMNYIMYSIDNRLAPDDFEYMKDEMVAPLLSSNDNSEKFFGKEKQLWERSQNPLRKIGKFLVEPHMFVDILSKSLFHPIYHEPIIDVGKYGIDKLYEQCKSYFKED